MRPEGYAHQDLYGSPDVYDAMFAWNPSAEARYLAALAERFSRARRGGVFLDIGCGTGRVAGTLNGYAALVICLDISASMLLRAAGRGVAALNADMAGIPLRSGSVDVAYSMLAAVNHLDSYAALRRHLAETRRVLRRGGVYIADLVLEEPPCIGLCDEWDAVYSGVECRARHVVESWRGDRFIEVLELRCGDEVVARSRSSLLLPGAGAFTRAALESGFKGVVFLEPFRMREARHPRGRVFAVLLG